MNNGRYKKPKPLSNNEKAAKRVEDAIASGKILTAYNALGREQTTVGPYHEAVDSGIRFAVIGDKSGRHIRCRTATDAAWAFVDVVGSTRAREAALR